MTTLKSPKATLCWARLGHLGQLDRNEHPDPVIVKGNSPGQEGPPDILKQLWLFLKAMHQSSRNSLWCWEED